MQRCYEGGKQTKKQVEQQEHRLAAVHSLCQLLEVVQFLAIELLTPAMGSDCSSQIGHPQQNSCAQSLRLPRSIILPDTIKEAMQLQLLREHAKNQQTRRRESSAHLTVWNL